MEDEKGDHLMGDRKRPSVAVVGSGSLGRYYLLGLLDVSFPLEIYVVDVDPGALAESKAVWEVAGRPGGHLLNFLSSPRGLPNLVDLAIVATTADHRAEVARRVVDESRVAYWVFEKVLGQSIEDLEVLGSIASTSEAAWVNTWGRSIDWYQQVRALAGRGGPYGFSATGGSWGMGCNSIHLIDLCSWWSGEGLAFVDASGLGSRWWPAKRPGFHEPSGRLEAVFDGGSTLTMIARPPGPGPDGSSVAGRDHLDQIIVDAPTGRWEFEGPWSESNGIARGPDGDLVHGRISYQSERTAPLVQEILLDGRCGLTAMAESVALHRPLLEALIDHWNGVTGETGSLVPIT